MSHTTKSPLISDTTFFESRNGYSLVIWVKLPIFGFLVIILEILKFLNCSYFATILTRKPKIGNLTNMTELYLFLESKKWYLLFKGLLWSHDRENHQLDTCSRFSFVSSAFIAGTSTAYNWIAFLWNILSFIWTYQVSVITTQKLFLIFFFWPISQNNLQYMKKIHTEKSEW